MTTIGLGGLAAAQTPTPTPTPTPSPSTTTSTTTTTIATTTTSTTGVLPHTGIDLWVPATAGGLALAASLGARRALKRT